MEIMENLKQFSDGIAEFIVHWLAQRGELYGRTFYGESFILALLQRSGRLDAAMRDKLLDAYAEKDKADPAFHWEFNLYALMDFAKEAGGGTPEVLQGPMRFKHTSCTNWTLLRSNTRLAAGLEQQTALREARERLDRFQRPSGLIMDDPGVKSFQYHCFSTALTGELFQRTEQTYFLERFRRGVVFIRHFILNNGDTLYVGRGQEQSFGYAALLYALALAYTFDGDASLLGDMQRILSFLQQHRRADGSFPLVMNGTEKTIPELVDLDAPEYCGWYAYNNYFDYLPFMGYFMAKAYAVLQSVELRSAETREPAPYRDADFVKIVKPRYEAVLSKCGGYWTNDLPIPYIVTDGRALTPCYGGEQFVKSLYGIEGIPLPYCDTLKKSIRWRSFSFFGRRTLWLFSPLGIMKREYAFGEQSVKIITKVFSIFRFRHLYLWRDTAVPTAADMEGKRFEGYEYSASGRLRKYAEDGASSVITIRIVA